HSFAAPPAGSIRHVLLRNPVVAPSDAAKTVSAFRDRDDALISPPRQRENVSMRGAWTGAARAAGAAIVAGLAMATSGSLSAQQNNGARPPPSIMADEKPAVAPAQSPQPPKPAKSKRTRVQTPAAEQNPDLDAADQLAPSQVSQPLPAAVRAPTRTQTTALAAPPGAAAGKPPRANSNLV